MTTRKTRPEFKASPELSEDGQKRFDRWLGMLEKSPSIMGAVLHPFKTSDEVVAEAEKLNKSRTREATTLSATAAILRHGDILEIIPDPETVHAMRREQANNDKLQYPRDWTLVWLGAAATEVMSHQHYLESIQPNEFRTQNNEGVA